MYLQLAGLEPLNTAENPLAPGATPYKYKNYYLGQGQDIILPDALFPPNVEGYAAALKSVADLRLIFMQASFLGNEQPLADLIFKIIA